MFGIKIGVELLGNYIIFCMYIYIRRVKKKHALGGVCKIPPPLDLCSKRDYPTRKRVPTTNRQTPLFVFEKVLIDECSVWFQRRSVSSPTPFSAVEWWES